MILVPSFDIPSGFRLGKITEECPFQGPVFFELIDGLLTLSVPGGDIIISPPRKLGFSNPDFQLYQKDFQTLTHPVC